MTVAATQAASTTIRWYSRVRAAMKSAAAWVAARPLALAQWAAGVSSWKFDLFLLAMQIVILVALLVTASKKPPASTATATAADQLHSLESRVSALEATVAGLVVATPAPASPSARRPVTASPAAAVTANATPAPPTGHTDLDRRLAEFQRRIDATPSPTTTLKETAK